MSNVMKIDPKLVSDALAKIEEQKEIQQQVVDDIKAQSE